MIDVYGHFGTLLSYATVASFVARVLRNENLLGNVHNFDPEWHPAFAELASASDTRASHVMVFAPPRLYVGEIAKRYGKMRSAIFSSPNTDRMAKEHVETTLEYGTVVAPSAWCARSLSSGIDRLPVSDMERRTIASGSEIVQLPLGVSDVYTKRMARVEREPGSKIRVFHTGTDQGWPGRKGTEELLEAWALGKLSKLNAELTVHIPQGLRREALYKLADLEINDEVNLIVGGERGTDDAELNRLYSAADLIVQPSRCEGFGMMILAALVRDVPLLTTYVTGQVDFLREYPALWMPVPTGPEAPIAGEDGLAPTVEPPLLAAALIRAVGALSTRKASGWIKPGFGTWGSVEARWCEWIAQWIEETT